MMKIILSLASILLMAGLRGEPSDINEPDVEESHPAFLNPSSRNHPANHEIRQQRLNDAYVSAEKKILDQIVWNVDPERPIEKVEVHLGEQKLYAFQNSYAVGISPVSTAAQGYVTPVGAFKISDKKEIYYSNQYGEFADANGKIVDYNANLGQTPPPGVHYVPSPMPHFLRLTDNGVGLHEGYLPGYPASHGCIRLPATVAANLFKQVSIGTPVLVTE